MVSFYGQMKLKWKFFPWIIYSGVLEPPSVAIGALVQGLRLKRTADGECVRAEGRRVEKKKIIIKNK